MQLTAPKADLTKITLDIDRTLRERLDRATQEKGRGAQRRIIEAGLEYILAKIGY